MRGRNNGRGGSSGTTWEVDTVSQIITNNDSPPIMDKHGLPDGLSQPVPLLEFDIDWAFLARYPIEVFDWMSILF